MLATLFYPVFGSCERTFGGRAALAALMTIMVILLLATGALLKGLVLLLGGSLLIGLADNVLRPLLVGRDTQMPDYLILLTTLGGLTLFGLSGVVIGPVVAALSLAVWAMFAEEYAGADFAELLAPAPDDAASSSPAPYPRSGVPRRGGIHPRFAQFVL